MSHISRFTRPKTLPLRSIGLTKIDENMPFHHFMCPCDMCNKYQDKKVSEFLNIQTQQINQKIASRARNKHGVCTTHYLWIIKHLIIPQNKIISRGLDIFIPQILFYRDGQPKKMYCLREVDDPVVKAAHKGKITNNFILQVFGDRRRKYRQIVSTFLGKKKEVVTKKPMFGNKKQVKKQAKDGVVIKYMDGLEQLISESQFLHLLQRRKQDPIWKQLYYIKNYIGVEDFLTRTVIVRFDRKDIQYEEMFKRAFTLMRVYGENIQKQQEKYISDKQQVQFCKDLAKQSLQIFATYNLYKIVNFIEYFYDEKINNIVAKFLVNEMSQPYLDDVMKLEYESQLKFQWTNQTYLKKIDQQQQRVFFSKVVQTDPVIEENSLKIQNYMGRAHEKMKEFYKLSKQVEDNAEEKANNDFFKLIHPQIELPISEILRMPGMTVEKFKKDYLGYKSQKKPIIKPFNSNLIKSLHNMAPRFQQADPHEYVKVPKRSVSTSFSTNSSQKKRRFSQSKNFTNFSTNMTSGFSTPLFTSQ